MEIFIELSIIVLIATAFSLLMKLLRQPLVVGYILTGIIVGPYAFNILHSTEMAEVFSKIGITTLLFIVGLSLNPSVIKEVGKVSFLGGLGQIVFTAVIGFFIVRAFGFSALASVYVALALTFSSTIIILKLLSDTGNLQKLHGKITIGFLLMQDLAAIAALLIVSASAMPEERGFVVLASALAIKGALATVALYLVSRYVLPKLSRWFASSQELLFLFSIAWGMSMAAFFYYLGFSLEIGALIAGVTLAASPFAYEIGSRMKPLRDFFVVIFFVLLGSQLVVSDIGSLIVPAIVLSIFVLVGNPIIVIVIMNLLGYRRRTGFFVGLAMAQISEFSLILVALAYSLGHISQEVVSLVTLVGIITIAGSTYLILHTDAIYARLEWLVKLLEFRRKYHRNLSASPDRHDIIIFGYDRVGSDFVQAAEKIGKKYLVVDFNPASIEKLQQQGIPFKYGDAEDVEFLHELELAGTELVISTIPDFRANALLVKTYRQANKSGIIIVLSHDVEHAKKLYLEGASYVIMPHYLGAHHAAQMVSRYGADPIEFEKERNHHLVRLSKRSAA